MTFRTLVKIAAVAALVLVTILALGPAKWQPRSGLGWEIDHFVGYFVITLMFCVAWPRPLVVGGALVVFAGLLELAQVIPPDRSSNIFAAIYSACGVITAALIAELALRVQRRFQSKPMNRQDSYPRAR